MGVGGDYGPTDPSFRGSMASKMCSVAPGVTILGKRPVRFQLYRHDRKWRTVETPFSGDLGCLGERKDNSGMAAGLVRPQANQPRTVMNPTQYCVSFALALALIGR